MADNGLSSLLTGYESAPAVFWNKIPSDTDVGWADGKAYPRIVCVLHMGREKGGRNYGTLQITVQSLKTETPPAQIGQAVREVLQDLMLCPSETLYSAVWSKTEDPIAEAVRAEAAEIVNELYFDVLEYPVKRLSGISETEAGIDPVQSLGRFMQEEFAEIRVAGQSAFPSVLRLVSNAPVVYCRLASMEYGALSNTVQWINAVVSVQVMCPAVLARLHYVKELADLLACKGEFLLSDGSLMQLRKLKVNPEADYFTDGQMKITVSYGLARKRVAAGKLQEVIITGVL